VSYNSKDAAEQAANWCKMQAAPFKLCHPEGRLGSPTELLFGFQRTADSSSDSVGVGMTDGYAEREEGR
jgi:hypothetical protein